MSKPIQSLQLPYVFHLQSPRWPRYSKYSRWYTWQTFPGSTQALFYILKFRVSRILRSLDCTFFKSSSLGAVPAIFWISWLRLEVCIETPQVGMYSGKNGLTVRLGEVCRTRSLAINSGFLLFARNMLRNTGARWLSNGSLPARSTKNAVWKLCLFAWSTRFAGSLLRFVAISKVQSTSFSVSWLVGWLVDSADLAGWLAGWSSRRDCRLAGWLKTNIGTQRPTNVNRYGTPRTISYFSWRRDGSHAGALSSTYKKNLIGQKGHGFLAGLRFPVAKPLRPRKGMVLNGNDVSF